MEIKCELRVQGSAKANAIAQSDLDVPDPDEKQAIAILKKALEEDDDEGKATRNSSSDNS